MHPNTWDTFCVMFAHVAEFTMSLCFSPITNKEFDASYMNLQSTRQFMNTKFST
jgi:hypothetical protein